MNWEKIGLAVAAGLLLTGCATSNPFSNIPVEDRSGQAGESTQPGSSGVVVTPSDPGISVRPIESEPVIRAQRDVLPPADEVWQPTQQPVSEPAGQQPSSQNTAVLALLDSAKQESAGGDLRAAQTRLERAQRISPREPEVYYQLADVKRQLGQFMDAEQVALKGIDVASGQGGMLRRLWALISQIRTEAGDLAGADDARQQAARH
ncbi:tetratricopeptide repeat protein [Nitrincola iocasae]|uniref:Tetratricopeptide repeat protein n=1 Tax=Nitrincola iocasae TaxID=2614693 RepID=A0A5J6LAY6_9GAMM|nr:tetratricopeptide repeat protein [Nitrincola iocasae]QEW05526.1 tetratricopeptide repeat protein [Nitrincola iocasae]